MHLINEYNTREIQCMVYIMSGVASSNMALASIRPYARQTKACLTAPPIIISLPDQKSAGTPPS